VIEDLTDSGDWRLSKIKDHEAVGAKPLSWKSPGRCGDGRSAARVKSRFSGSSSLGAASSIVLAGA